MMTHYLRFTDEDAAMAAIADAGLMADGPDGPTPILASHTHAMDLVGVIILPGKVDLVTGKQLTDPVTLDGWHVNYIGELPDGWDAHLVHPQHPIRVFG